MNRFQRGEFGIPLISGQHRAKTIGGCEYQFDKIRAASLGKFAELVESARGRIAFQGVYRAAKLSNHFLVTGMSFELQAGFVERLQQFAGTLEEERAQLAVAVLGRAAAHEL